MVWVVVFVLCGGGFCVDSGGFSVGAGVWVVVDFWYKICLEVEKMVEKMWKICRKIAFSEYYQTLEIDFRTIFHCTPKHPDFNLLTGIHFPLHLFYTQNSIYIKPNAALVKIQNSQLSIVWMCPLINQNHEENFNKQSGWLDRFSIPVRSIEKANSIDRKEFSTSRNFNKFSIDSWVDSINSRFLFNRLKRNIEGNSQSVETRETQFSRIFIK